MIVVMLTSLSSKVREVEYINRDLASIFIVRYFFSSLIHGEFEEPYECQKPQRYQILMLLYVPYMYML